MNWHQAGLILYVGVHTSSPHCDEDNFCLRFVKRGDASLRRNGFTLIEMLIVIAIILVIAALLMPAMQQALTFSRQASCNNNYKQLGMAYNLYQNDNFGAFPSAESSIGYAKYIKPYLDDSYPSDWYVSSPVFLCTETDQTLPTLVSKIVGVNFYAVGGQYKGGSYPDGRHAWPRIQIIRYPSRQLVLVDTFNSSYPESSHYRAFAGINGSSGTGMVAGRHAGRASVLFADNHVENLPEYELQTAPDPYYSLPWNYYLK